MAIKEGIISNLAAKALESLAKAVYTEAASWWGARDELKKLEVTMKFVEARICDAERRQEGDNSDSIRLWLRSLKMVLYRADDLFDKILAVDRQNQQQSTLVNKVGILTLFSKSSPLSFNIKLAHEIKSIRKQLNAVKSDMDGLNLSANFVEPLKPDLIKNRETASFVISEDVIGRDYDKEVIINMLFDPIYDEEMITIIPIVGLGGLGKTTLAQLVYNDKGVQNHFDLRKWVCVPEVNNWDAVMRRVYMCLTGENSSDTPLDDIKSGILCVIKDKKYLLVLDDIWDESGHRWLDIFSLLRCGGVGSKVVVTTRSEVVAEVVRTIPKAYKLGVLTDDDSWNLFKRLAFKQNQGQNNPTLIKIGREVVKSCGNVPLAITVVGSLLSSKRTEKEWRLFRKDQLISKEKSTEDDTVMRTLKLSYDYLKPALKQCFAYCSLFPKDYRYYKVHLVRLWMAQGYVETDNAEQFFMELLERSLFQDPEEDGEGNLVGCKMHDLVHDLAQRIAGDECKLLDDPLIQITDGIIHLSVDVPVRDWEVPLQLLNARQLRSFLTFATGTITASSLKQVIWKCKTLRALDLEGMGIEMVPNSIGKLIHLRYINLARTNIKCLPDAITRLEYLQTLNLWYCYFLEKLPRDFAKLVNLKLLLISCTQLTDLPPGFGNMTSLQVLDRFVVGESSGIDSLPALNLMGGIEIEYYKWRREAVLEAERANLKSNTQLTSLSLDFGTAVEGTNASRGEMDDMLMSLGLPQNLINLQVCFHGGYAMPRSWLDGLRMLVSVTIGACSNCNALPHLSRLPSLERLSLYKLPCLEYIEDENDIGVGGADFYFPSLEVLKLEYLTELKRWTRPSNVDGVPRQLLFPRLSELRVYDCRKLMSMPLAPELKSLDTMGFNGNLLKPYMALVDQGETSSSPLVTPCSTLFPTLKTMRISGEDELISLPISNRLSSLESLIIGDVDQLMSLTLESPTSIRDLTIFRCKSLRNLSVGNLCALETLDIGNSDEAITITGWEGLRSIRSLTLSNINNTMENLPQQIVCLTTLQHLEIKRLPNLIELPQEMGNFSMLSMLKIEECPKLTSLPPSLLVGLTSLHKLVITNCPELQKRYQETDLHQHIPQVFISTHKIIYCD